MNRISAKQELEKFKHIIAQLMNEDSDERRWAVYDLEDFEPVDSIEYLVKAIQDENRAVRDAASEVLQGMPHELSTKLLTPLLGSTRIEVRNIVATVLVTYGEAAVAELQTSLFDKNEDVRKFVVDILGLAGSDKAVPGLCKVSLKDRVDNVRSSAVEALGKIRSAEALPALYEILKSQEGPIAEAAEAIGHIGQAESIPLLEQSLKTKDPLLAFAVVEALGKIGIESSLLPLYNMLEESPGLLKAEIILSILSIGKRQSKLVLGDDFPQLIGLILQRLAEDDTNLAELVSCQFALSPSSDILKLFYVRAYDLPSNILIKLIRCSKNNPSLEQEVCSLADHSDEWVGFTAVENLSESGSDLTRGKILQILENGEGMKVLAAINMAVLLNQPEALPLLKTLENSKNPDIRNASSRAYDEISKASSSDVMN